MSRITITIEGDFQIAVASGEGTPVPTPSPTPTPSPSPTPQPTPTPTPGPSLPPASNSPDTEIIEIPWPREGQVRPMSRNFRGGGKLIVRTRVPDTLPPFDHNGIGILRIVEVPGQPSTARDILALRNGLTEWHEIGSGNPAPRMNFTLENSPNYQALGAQFNANFGDILSWVITNPGLEVGASANVLIDFRTPNGEY